MPAPPEIAACGVETHPVSAGRIGSRSKEAGLH